MIPPDKNSCGRARRGWWGQRGGAEEEALGQGSVSGESHPRGGEESRCVPECLGKEKW